MIYNADFAAIQRRLADTSDLNRRRLAVLDAIAARPGDRVLEVGCGGGALLPRLAACVGSTGRVVGIDISADQIAAANQLCLSIDVVETAVGDLRQLPYATASFDAIAAIQVIEYLEAPAEALSELRRVCTARGRLAILATNWDTMFCHPSALELTRRVQTAWRTHAPHANLPAELPPLLSGAGFQTVYQAPVTIINNAYHADAFAYWGSRLMVAFAVGRGLVSKTEAAAWLEALVQADREGTFFFSLTPILTFAVTA